MENGRDRYEIGICQLQASIKRLDGKALCTKGEGDNNDCIANQATRCFRRPKSLTRLVFSPQTQPGVRALLSATAAQSSMHSEEHNIKHESLRKNGVVEDSGRDSAPRSRSTTRQSSAPACGVYSACTRVDVSNTGEGCFQRRADNVCA